MAQHTSSNMAIKDGKQKPSRNFPTHHCRLDVRVDLAHSPQIFVTDISDSLGISPIQLKRDTSVSKSCKSVRAGVGWASSRTENKRRRPKLIGACNRKFWVRVMVSIWLLEFWEPSGQFENWLLSNGGVAQFSSAVKGGKLTEAFWGTKPGAEPHVAKRWTLVAAGGVAAVEREKVTVIGDHPGRHGGGNHGEGNFVKYEPVNAKPMHMAEPINGKLHLRCPDSYSLIENTCVKSVSAAPVSSCPYGTHRDEKGRCLSVDSVPPERTCPAGFESYDKGCIKRVVIDAIPKCAHELGFKLEQQPQPHCALQKSEAPIISCREGLVLSHGKCTATRFSEPTFSCPGGHETFQGKCRRQVSVPRLHYCSDERFKLCKDSKVEAIVCRRIIEVPAKLECRSGFSLQGNKCIKTRTRRTQGPCGEGFLFFEETLECILATTNGAIPYCKNGWVYEPNRQKCSKTLYEDPVLVCPKSPSALNGGHSISLLSPVTDSPGCLAAELAPLGWSPSTNSFATEYEDSDKKQTDIPRSKFADAMHEVSGAEIAIEDGKFGANVSEQGPSWDPREASQWEEDNAEIRCSHKSLGQRLLPDGVAMCLEVEVMASLSSCSTAQHATPPDITSTEQHAPHSGITEVALSRRLQEVKHLGKEAEESSPHLWKNSETSCLEWELRDGMLLCPNGLPPSDSSRCKDVQEFPAEVRCRDGFQHNNSLHLCMVKQVEGPLWECPPGYGMLGSFSEGMPSQSIKNTIPPSSNRLPIVEYHGSLTKSVKKYEDQLAQLARVRHRANQSGKCEKIEYATVQVVCPMRYRMETSRSGKSCMAEKIIPPVAMCSPGFFMNGQSCVKHVVVAPSVVGPTENPVACSLRGGTALACAHSLEYPVVIKQEKFGRSLSRQKQS